MRLTWLRDCVIRDARGSPSVRGPCPGRPIRARPIAFIKNAPLLLSLAACAVWPDIDRPVPLDPGYAAREAAAGKPADRCGPEFISDRLPAPLVSLIGPALDGPFRPVCARHDACYELREETQAWCDTRMQSEMQAICDVVGHDNAAGGMLCRLRARLYFNMVDNRFGAYSYHGGPGGRIAQLQFEDTSPRKVTVCATVENTTPLLQEYVLELRDHLGRRLAREPEVQERNLRPGETEQFCIGLARTPERPAREASTDKEARPVGPNEVRLLADDPDSMALTGDLLIVDRRALDLAQLEAD